MKVRRLPLVDFEAKQAARYYKAFGPKLSEVLMHEVESSIQRILRFPKGWEPIDADLRQCVGKGFSYTVIYTFQDGEGIVAAFADTPPLGLLAQQISANLKW